MTSYECGAKAAIEAFNCFQSSSRPDWKHFEDAVRPAASISDKLSQQEIEQLMEAEFVRGFHETMAELEVKYPQWGW